MQDFCIYLLSCSIFLYILNDYLIRFANKQIKSSLTYFLMIVCSAFLGAINCLELPLLNFSTTIFVSIIIAKFLYKASNYIINIIAMIVILAISEAIAILGYNIINNFFKLPFKNITNNSHILVLLTSIINIFIYKRFVYRLYGIKFTSINRAIKICYVLFSFFTIFNIYLLLLLSNIIINNYIVILCWICIATLLFTNLFFVKIIETLSKSNDKLIDYQILKYKTNYYEEINKKYEQMQKVLHDIKNHISTLTAALHTRNQEQNIEIYTDEIAYKIESVFKKKYSLHPLLNIILTEKSAIMEDNGIKFIYRENITHLDFLKPYDIVTIFGNLLDNAINATYNLSEDNRWIKLILDKVNNMLIINISNPFEKSNKNRIIKHIHPYVLHGNGLENIKSIVISYQGDIQISSDNNIFEIIIII